MRANGFQRPFNPMQVGTWVLLPVLLLEFLLFATPVLPLAASIPCTIGVFACGLASAYFTFRCCSIDPVDQRLCRHLSRQRQNTTGQTTEGGGDNGTTNSDSKNCIDGGVDEQDAIKFCWVCNVDVHESSMHCKFCNKCVKKFDHHCHWLNTCVGEANYKCFFRAIGSTLGMELLRGGILSGLVVTFFVQYYSSPRVNNKVDDGSLSDAIVDRFDYNNWFGVSGLVMALVNVGFFIIDAVCIVMLLQLFTFHVRLRREGITTYTYIVRDGQRKQERMRKRMQLERKRISAVEKAAQEGKLIRQWRLSAAGVPYIGESLCRLCDPLRWEHEQTSEIEMQHQLCTKGKTDCEQSGFRDSIHGDDGVENGCETSDAEINMNSSSYEEMDGKESMVHSTNDGGNVAILYRAIEDRKMMLQQNDDGDESTGKSIARKNEKIEFLSS